MDMMLVHVGLCTRGQVNLNEWESLALPNMFSTNWDCDLG